MGNSIHITLDDQKVREAFARAPQVMARQVEASLKTGAQEVAVEAKERAPKFQSNLVNSIKAMRVGDLHFMVSTGVNYARAVEEGTGPAAGKPRYFPNVQSLFQVLMTSPKSRGFSWARHPKKPPKKGFGKRSDQEMELVFRAKAWAWHTYNHGTPKQPFMAPALEAKRSRLFDLIAEGSARGLREVFG